MESYQLFLFVICLIIKESLGQLSQNKDELLNWCLKSQNHKHLPGKEDSLHEQCAPWKDHACCTESVTRDVHQLNMYNFSFDHCYSQVKRNMSEQCRKFFIQDNCFYECEPHIGFWVVNTTRKISTERFYKVPLCASDCDAWFEACQNDFTCVYNWPQDFKFKAGLNKCPENSKCITFKQMYESSEEFCENVWDNSWEYTKDEDHCMHVSFDGISADTNRKTAEYYIDKVFSTNKGSSPSLSFGLLASVVVATISWKNDILH